MEINTHTISRQLLAVMVYVLRLAKVALLWIDLTQRAVITFMAQMNPLEAPERDNLRPEYQELRF